MPRLLALYSANSAVCGIGTWLECLSGELSRRGWEVTVGLSWGRRFHDPAAIEAARPSLQTVWLDGRTGTAAGRWLAVRRAIRQVDPSLVLVTLLDDGLRAMQIEKRAGSEVRFAVANHGNAPAHLAATLELAEELDLAVSVNLASYQVLRDWPGADWPPGVLHRIPNAVPGPHGGRPPRTSRPACIGYVGRLARDKGVHELPPFAEALFDLLPACRLWVAGDGPEQPAVDSLAARYPGRVRTFGAVSRTTLYTEVYPQLDVLICFSPSEGWPMSLAEAMVHGVVPVTSEYTGIHLEGVVRHGDTGIIFPVGDWRQAADCAARLLQDQAELERLSRNAAAEISAKHSLDEFGRRWDECLRACLARPCRRTGPGVAGPRLTASEIWKERLRRLLGRQVRHASVRAEWPMLAGRDPALTERVTQALG